MNKHSAHELYIRLTSIHRIDAGPARECIKDWVKGHRDATYAALEELAAKQHRMSFVTSTYMGKYATESDNASFSAYSPVVINATHAAELDYMWLTDEALYVRVNAKDYEDKIVTAIIPADVKAEGESAAFWRAVADEFATTNSFEFGGELQVMKDGSVHLVFRFRKDIPDFITPHPKG